MGLRRGAEQTCGNQHEYVALSGRESGKVRFCDLHRGNDRMVVRDLCIVRHPFQIRLSCMSLAERHIAAKPCNKVICRAAHILGKILAIRSRIRRQLLFIQRLQVVKSLLRRVSVKAVCFSLQSGKVVELRGLHGLCLFLYRLYPCVLSVTSLFERLPAAVLSSVFFTGSREAAAGDLRHKTACFQTTKSLPLVLQEAPASGT